LAEGYFEEEIMKYIGCVVSSEIFSVLKEGKSSTRQAMSKRYVHYPNCCWMMMSNNGQVWISPSGLRFQIDINADKS